MKYRILKDDDSTDLFVCFEDRDGTVVTTTPDDLERNLAMWSDILGEPLEEREA